jgi:flagellar protein FliS
MEETMPTPFSQYQNIQVTTSNPEKILIMLYDGAINFTKIAIDRLAKGDRAGKGMYIGKAHAIVGELMGTLNHEVGGEIAKQLERLYLYLIDEFIAANINNNPGNLENAVRIMTTMRDTWMEAVEIVKKEREAGDVRLLGRVG